MNLSNKLTLSRIVLTFLFMLLLFSKGFFAKLGAFFVFFVATWTDFLDGYLAKTRNEITEFGKFMDPIADKVLVISALLAFVEMKLVPAWIVVIIILREFIITGLRIVALSKGKVIQAERAGKHKTVSQIVSIYLILIFIVLRSYGTNIKSFWNMELEKNFLNIIFGVMLITALFTVISGVSYLVRNRYFFITNEKNS